MLHAPPAAVAAAADARGPAARARRGAGRDAAHALPALRQVERLLLRGVPAAHDNRADRAAAVQPVRVRERGGPRYAAARALQPLTPRARGRLTHAQQNLTTATGVHLALLAPAHARLLSVDDLPPLNAATTVVLFPDDAAVSAEAVDVSSITDVLVVDSKWGQARGVVASERLRGMRHVRLNAYLTSYWRRAPALPRLLRVAIAPGRAGAERTAPRRYHTAGVPPDGLCTVEAVFFLCRELHTSETHRDCHCFDNLLWYFAHQHAKALCAKSAPAPPRLLSAEG